MKKYVLCLLCFFIFTASSQEEKDEKALVPLSLVEEIVSGMFGKEGDVEILVGELPKELRFLYPVFTKIPNQVLGTVIQTYGVKGNLYEDFYIQISSELTFNGTVRETYDVLYAEFIDNGWQTFGKEPMLEEWGFVLSEDNLRGKDNLSLCKDNFMLQISLESHKDYVSISMALHEETSPQLDLRNRDTNVCDETRLRMQPILARL